MDTGAKSPNTWLDDATVGNKIWVWTENEVGGTPLLNDNKWIYYATDGDPATDYSVKLVIGGIISGDNKANGASLTDTSTYTSYGSSVDLWGLTPTVDQINASNFGMVFSVRDVTYISHYIKVTNFGFSIPPGVTIDGVKVEVKVRQHLFTSPEVDHIRITVYYTGASTNCGAFFQFL